MASPQNNAEKETFVAGIKSSFVINAASMAILYLSQFLLARMMKVEQYGVYVYSLSWLTILLLLGNLGLDAAALRYIPQYVSRGEWGYCRGIIKRSFQIVFPVSLMLLLGGWSVILINRSHLTEENLIGALLIGMAALPLWTAIRLTQGILQAFKRPGLSQFLDGMLSPLLLLSMLGLAITLNISISAQIVMAVFAVSCAVVLVVGVAWLRRYVMPAQVKTADGEYKTREWLTFSIPMLMIAGTYVIMNNTDVIMIGMMKDTAQAGIYSAATRLAALVSVSLVFVNMVLTPYISEYFYNDRREDLQHFISLSARIVALFAVPMFFILMIYGKHLLGLFGGEFKNGYHSLMILICGQLVNVLSGSVGYIMIMTGRQKQAAYVLAATAALNIILNLILIPPFGIEGAAVATAVALIAWNVVLVVYIRNRINLNSTIFSAMKAI
jgi:O-antigen/teichoic acid export membrane protein